MSSKTRTFSMLYQSATDKLYKVVITPQTAFAYQVGAIGGSGANKAMRDFDRPLAARVTLTLVDANTRNAILNGELHPSAVCVRSILSGPAALSTVLT